MDDLTHWIALAHLNALTLAEKHRLLHQYSSPSTILKLDTDSLNLRSTPKHQYFESYIDQQMIDKAMNWVNQSPDHHIIHCQHNDYPELLKQIPSPPLLLYLIGDKTLLKNMQIAMVGSRKATIAGTQIAQQFASQLCELGFTVTSGMALGIDANAHQGALNSKGKTIAVLGTGVDICYPRRNLTLYNQIAQYGLLVSEFTLASAPLAEHFPRRNRIISGLSRGILIVEAARRSGSLISARHALQQNREVFAIPGSIHSPMASGCLHLIKQGAKLTCNVQDILEEFSEFSGMNLDNTATTNESTLNQLNRDAQHVLSLLNDVAVSFDKLISQSGLTVDQLCSILLDLELQGNIEKLPGNQYLKTASVN